MGNEEKWWKMGNQKELRQATTASLHVSPSLGNYWLGEFLIKSMLF